MGLYHGRKKWPKRRDCIRATLSRPFSRVILLMRLLTMEACTGCQITARLTGSENCIEFVISVLTFVIGEGFYPFKAGIKI